MQEVMVTSCDAYVARAHKPSFVAMPSETGLQRLQVVQHAVKQGETVAQCFTAVERLRNS